MIAMFLDMNVVHYAEKRGARTLDTSAKDKRVMNRIICVVKEITCAVKVVQFLDAKKLVN